MSSLPVNKSLTESQRRCAEILAQNDLYRLTIEEIAEEVGVSERTVYRWKKDKEFVRYTNEVAELLMEDALSEAYVELKKIMRSGSSEKAKLKAIEMIMSSRGKLKHTQEITHKHEDMYDPQAKRKEIIDMDIDSLE